MNEERVEMKKRKEGRVEMKKRENFEVEIIFNMKRQYNY